MSENIHATGLVLDRVGLVLRGPSGSGKSLLALHLLDQWTWHGRDAALVSDDRVELQAVEGSLFMTAPSTIAGLIELRGRGIVRRPHRSPAALHLVVDLVDRYERMVEDDEFSITLLGVTLARCPVPRLGLVDLGHQALLIREALTAL